ncbi:MAG: MBL fold metallo-hydrolase [Candidatus Shapirobacteria bacterium]|jgi:phosphoribosyl 1,2-cyclic phosphate phosphodiesterase
MNITFLGTAAATSYPLAFCRCDFCNKARELGGKDFRKRSSIIINDDLLIDFGPDVLSASFMYDKSIVDIRYLLQTHSHSDHFDPSHFTTRIPEYMGVNTPPLQLYGSEATLKKMSEMIRNEGYVSDIFDQKERERLNLEVFPVKPLQTFNFGNYQVTAFATDHDNSVDSLLYSITEGNFTIFYGTDTDTLSEDVWQGMKDKNLKFNIVILDHTYGPNADSGGHLNANRFIEHVQRFKAENLLADNTRILATHISHEGNPTHDKLAKYASQYGYEIAYDGLTI